MSSKEYKPLSDEERILLDVTFIKRNKLPEMDVRVQKEEEMDPEKLAFERRAANFILRMNGVTNVRFSDPPSDLVKPDSPLRLQTVEDIDSFG
ncbi:MAG TPA: hypothetical protein VG917_04680 [Patescibacteria group bacterium]|nr:hypothetical protein [Patescibacteria group bacterium]